MRDRRNHYPGVHWRYYEEITTYYTQARPMTIYFDVNNPNGQDSYMRYNKKYKAELQLKLAKSLLEPKALEYYL